MSLSNPNADTVTPNPANRFYEWGGKKGNFQYYDKELKQKVEIPLPFTFIPLDILVTLKGYNKKKDKGFWSNEIRNTKTDKIVIRSSDGIEKEGLYADLKDFMELNKINYVQSVYIAYKNDKEALTLGNIQIKTSSLTPWIEYTKKNKPIGLAVSVASFSKEQTGDVKFVSPIYKGAILKDKTKEEAIELDKQLQEYLNTYLAKNASAPTQPPTTSTNEPAKTQTSNEKMDEEDTGFGGSNNSDDDSIPF